MFDPLIDRLWTLGSKFDQVHPHHESIAALWNKKWKFPCQRSLYPFHDGQYEDFEPIFQTLIEKGIHDGYSVEYTREFLPTARDLDSTGDEAQAGGDKAKAIELFLRACAVYRIARFPYINSQEKREVYEAQKKTYMKAADLMAVPIRDVIIPHTEFIDGDDEANSIPLYIRFPRGASKLDPCPSVILLCGLDGHRPDNTVRSDEFTRRGWASVIVDIPGTADCPANRRDPRAADRLLTSILNWMRKEGCYDMENVLCWGLSAGGYNAVRAAHTHKDRLKGAIGQGAGTHHFFSRSWLEKTQWHEYPWNIVPALVEKYGYASHEEFMDNAQKDFSLIETGIAGMASCRLLLINGTHDGLMPIEDSILMMEHGSPKEGRFFPTLLHMGYPAANDHVYVWMESIIGIWKSSN